MAIPRNLSNLAPGADTSGVLGASKGGTGLTSPGASGNVLVSNGTNWTSGTVSAGKAADVQTFTSSGTWTKPSGFSSKARVLIECWGGGGSGAKGSSGSATSAGGGGGGGYNYRWIQLSSLGSTESVTIGSGGAARTSANTNGITGGNTSMGSYVTAYGGGGGAYGSFATGGGGGGQTSSGSSGGPPGGPGFISISSYFIPEGYGGNQNYGLNGQSAYYKGGGGGSQAWYCAPSSGYNGGDSVWGGGGGGSGSSSASNTSGGNSSYVGGGGAGGGQSTSGTNGTAPAGGGGATYYGATSGSGGNGYCVVTVFDGA